MAKTDLVTSDKLTERELRFVEEFIVSGNAAGAMKLLGCKASSARQGGYKMLHVPRVAAEVNRRKAERAEKLGIDAEFMLKRLEAEAMAKISEIFNKNGTLKPIHDWPDIFQMGLVAGVNVEELYEGRGKDRVLIGYLKKVRFSDRFPRLKALGDHINVGAFRQHKEHHIANPLLELRKQLQGNMISPDEEKA